MQNTAGSTTDEDIALPATTPEEGTSSTGDPFGTAIPEQQTALPVDPIEAVETDASVGWATGLFTFGLLVLLALSVFRIFRDREILQAARRETAEARSKERQARSELARVETPPDAKLQRRMRAMFEVNKKLRGQRTELERANARLKDLVKSDPLTGLMNAGRFTEQLESELRRSLRVGKPVTLFICDIDGFRGFNQTYGTGRGDLLLQRIADQIDTLFRRGGDVVARLGPDRFGILAPETDYQAAVEYAETFRGNIEKRDFADESSDLAELVTVSVGITEVNPDRPHETRDVLDRTALTLQLAKKKGGNRVLATRMRTTKGKATEAEIIDTRAAEPAAAAPVAGGIQVKAADGK